MVEIERTAQAVQVPVDDEVVRIIRNHAYGAMGAMIIVPFPGLDMVATYAVWGKMIREIAHSYGEELSIKDAQALASHLFESVVKTTIAWFGSAQLAASALKFVPLAGTAAAYLIDATIAAYGARKITAALGYTAAVYFSSGRTVGKSDMKKSVAELIKDPKALKTFLKALRKI